MWKLSEPGSIERLQIIYKIAERCNLNCTYCYYYHMGDETAYTRPAKVSAVATANLADWIRQGCEELDIPKVNISFHGGEPMLLKAVEFARICDVLIRRIAPIAELSLSIQTNGTLLTPGWLEALRRYRVQVGVSIDGRRSDNDRFRLGHRGESSFAATEGAIRRLLRASAGHPHLRPSTITVMHHDVDYRATYRYLRQLGIVSMHFLLPDRNAGQRSAETEEEARRLGRGLVDIFEAWMTEDDPDINVRFIQRALRHFELDRRPGPSRQTRKSNQILVARSDHTIAIDDSLIPALDWYRGVPDFPITTHTLRQVLEDPIFDHLKTAEDTLPHDCADCRWAVMCRGGDLENRYSPSTGFNNSSVYCATYKVLYAGICDFLIGAGYPLPEIKIRFGDAAYV